MLILPDIWVFDEKIKSKIDDYLSQGGKLLLSGKSGLDKNNEFCIDTGVKFIGENEFRPTYLIPILTAPPSISAHISMRRTTEGLHIRPLRSRATSLISAGIFSGAMRNPAISTSRSLLRTLLSDL